MDVEALRTFVAIHRTGSVTRASAELFRSQPAVTRRLQLLERELGVPLFERVPGGTVVSEAGRALLPFAESAIAIMRDAEAAVRAVTSEDSGPVSLALVGTLASTSLTALLRRFARLRPNVELRLRTATSFEVSELVRRADATVGLRYHGDPSPELLVEHLYVEQMTVVAAPDHRLAGVRCDSLSALAAERWLAFPSAPGRPEPAAAAVRRAFDAAGIGDERMRWIDSLTAQKRMVEAGFGVALVPTSAIQEELAAGTLTVLDVADLGLGIPVKLVTRRGGYLGAATRTLLDELRSTAAQMAQTG